MPETFTVWNSTSPLPEWSLPGKVDQPWLLHTSDPLLLNLTLRHGLRAGWNVWLAPVQWSEAQVIEAARRYGAAGVLAGSLAGPRWLRVMADGTGPGGFAAAQGSLGIFTSGTSGEPKLALHDWHRVRQPGEFAARRLPAARWLMTYNPTAYAGLQVFFTALATNGSVLYPATGAGAAADAVRHGRVEAISATPTWWRMLLAALPAEIALAPLLQASLGGERADQAILDAIRARFNPQRLTHIYASTEAGSAIVVSDGREGFPAAWLGENGRTVRLRIREGQLEIQSPYRMRGYADRPADNGAASDWYRTPDLVDLRGDRVLFIGRADTIANIGGAKVVLEEVEQELMGLGWFRDCRVYSRANPVTGTLLCADVVPLVEGALTIMAIKQALAERLPRSAQPQLVKIIQSIQLSANGKKIRT